MSFLPVVYDFINNYSSTSQWLTLTSTGAALEHLDANLDNGMAFVLLTRTEVIIMTYRRAVDFETKIVKTLKIPSTQTGFDHKYPPVLTQ